MTGKTLKELNAQPGDVVECGANGPRVIITEDWLDWGEWLPHWHLISRATDTSDTTGRGPKLWRDMTPEEKGALLLAHHEGKVIEIWVGEWVLARPTWCDVVAYRIRPEPKVEVVTFYWNPFYGNLDQSAFTTKGVASTHRITFNLIDGKPDCDSVKMEEL